MKLSIVLSTYNGEKYIADQLESLKNQERKADEVIIRDDCSTDGTVSIIEKFIKEENLLNWRLEINSKNKGWKINFRELIIEASGDLVFPCDQDDIWEPNKLEKMSDIMEQNPGINVLVSNYKEFYENGKEIILPKQNDEKIQMMEVRKNFMAIEYPGCTYCIRKTFVNLIIPCWKEYYAHDAITYRLSMFSGTLYTFNKYLINQRKYAQSTFTKEANKAKNKRGKIASFEFTENTIETINKYIDDNKSIDLKTSRDILVNAKQWNELRKDLYKKKSISVAIKLIRYLVYYPRKKQYIADLYYAFLGRE